jgi:pSer/pThr/pTyr-binding forkhead associated (FHA) protein
MKPYALINPNCENDLYIIKPGEIKIIGRAHDCGIILNNPTTSRHHARINHDADGTIYISDKNSENGTYYTRNDEEHRIIEKTQVFNNDRIRLGNISLLLKKIDLTALERKRNRDTDVIEDII